MTLDNSNWILNIQVEAVGHEYIHFRTELIRRLSSLVDMAIFFEKDSTLNDIGKWLKSYNVIKNIPNSEAIIDRCITMREDPRPRRHKGL